MHLRSCKLFLIRLKRIYSVHKSLKLLYLRHCYYIHKNEANNTMSSNLFSLSFPSCGIVQENKNKFVFYIYFASLLIFLFLFFYAQLYMIITYLNKG